MLKINSGGYLQKWIDGKYQKVSLDEIDEKEILLFIAGKLHSIRGMIVFFTFLTLIGMLGFLITFLDSMKQ